MAIVRIIVQTITEGKDSRISVQDVYSQDVPANEFNLKALICSVNNIIPSKTDISTKENT